MTELPLSKKNPIQLLNITRQTVPMRMITLNIYIYDVNCLHSNHNLAYQGLRRDPYRSRRNPARTSTILLRVNPGDIRLPKEEPFGINSKGSLPLQADEPLAIHAQRPAKRYKTHFAPIAIHPPKRRVKRLAPTGLLSLLGKTLHTQSKNTNTKTLRVIKYFKKT